MASSTMTLDPKTNPLDFLFSEDDPYACFKSIQRQIEIQEEKNLKHEQEVKTVPLVIGHFMEMIDTNNGSPTGINYYDRILSTINREMLKLVASVAVRHHSNDVLPPEADSSISLLSHSEKPDVTYSGLGPYSTTIKKDEEDVKGMAKRINDLSGINESDTGLVAPREWDLVSDKQMMQEEQPLQVARCTKIINPNTEDAKYVINVKQTAKRLVPSPPAPVASVSSFSGITRVLPLRTVSPTRNSVDHPVPAVPGLLPLHSVLPYDLCRDEEFGFFDECDIQTQPNSPENFSFFDIEERLRNFGAVEE